MVKVIWDGEEGGSSSASERTTFRCKVYFSTAWRVLHEQCPMTGCVHPWIQRDPHRGIITEADKIETVSM